MMKTLRRLTSTIVSSFDWMISQVENHESLVNAAISEIQEAGGRAMAQLKRVKQDGQNMRRRLQELRQTEELWAERAIGTAKLDEKKALECLRRKKKVQKEIAALEEQEREHAKLEKQLSSDLEVVKERITVLKQQRNVLRTRESRAQALRALQSDDPRLISEIDEILTRWESKVSEYELHGSFEAGSDQFEDDFVGAEEESELRSELSKLCIEDN